MRATTGKAERRRPERGPGGVEEQASDCGDGGGGLGSVIFRSPRRSATMRLALIDREC